ncbi:MAG: hypothetical protein ACKE8R_09385 [Methylophagaceae bacterium]
MECSSIGFKEISKKALGVFLLASLGTATAEVKTTLDNGSFETPVIGVNWTLIGDNEAPVPFWSTTDASGGIEIWTTGFLSVVSPDGNQHVELNATEASSISQSLCIAAGDEVSWSYKHRRRGTIVNEINLTIDGTDQGNNIAPTDDTWETVSGTYTAASTGLKAFVFDAINPAGGAGNFLDDIQVSNVSAFVEFASATYSDIEATGGNIPVLLIAGEVTTATTVDVTVTGGSADSSDFTNTMTVIIPVGIYDGTLATGIDINLTITDDLIYEPDDTIDFSISATGAEISAGNVTTCGDIAQTTTIYTILNDDAAEVPTLSQWALLLLIMFLALIGYRQETYMRLLQK